MKWLPKIHIHPVLIIFLAIAFVTGTFVELIVILTIVLFHELGHFAMARYFGWNIKGIMLWVFGGVMQTDEHGTRALAEEFLVIIAGPLQHIWVYVFVWLSPMFIYIPPHIQDIIIFYNSILLLFNLLPVWPLDGGRLLFSYISKITPYKKAYEMTIVFSMLACTGLLFIQVVIFPFTLTNSIVILFLFVENVSEWRRRHYVFMRFLLKRFHGDVSFRELSLLKVPEHYTVLQVFDLFRRDHHHYIKVMGDREKHLLFSEEECLRQFFQEKRFQMNLDHSL